MLRMCNVRLGLGTPRGGVSLIGLGQRLSIYKNAFIIEKSHLITLMFCPVYLDSHPGTNVFTKHPNLRTFAHEHDTEEHAQVAFALNPVIKKLGVEQVRGYRKITFLDCKTAVTPGMEHILFDISSIWRADIHHGVIIEMWSSLFLNSLHGLIGCPIHISFPVANIHIQSFL